MYYLIASTGDITVSMGPSHETMVIYTGMSKTLRMESGSMPCFFNVR
jgi:hypothetical protein